MLPESFNNVKKKVLFLHPVFTFPPIYYLEIVTIYAKEKEKGLISGKIKPSDLPV
jgi:hypothetical protein